MSVNLYNSSHKANSESYRRGWELVYEKKGAPVEKEIEKLPDAVKEGACRQRKALTGEG